MAVGGGGVTGNGGSRPGVALGGSVRARGSPRTSPAEGVFGPLSPSRLLRDLPLQSRRITGDLPEQLLNARIQNQTGGICTIWFDFTHTFAEEIHLHLRSVCNFKTNGIAIQKGSSKETKSPGIWQIPFQTESHFKGITRD